MKGGGLSLRLAATDLSNHVACGHLTSLNLAHAAGEIAGGYTNFDPVLKVLQERGRVHEAAYLEHLRAQGKRIESGGLATERWMNEGVEVITQAEFNSDHWHGRADFLIRVDRPSPRWAWSYEVIDTKLSSDTRAGTVLQLCVYSDLLTKVQQLEPFEMHVVKPGEGFPQESFRYDEYSAIYRAIRTDLMMKTSGSTGVRTYPEPTSHCDTCNWRSMCEARRRADDHLSYVADLGRSHQRELQRHQIGTLTELAHQPKPWPHKPERGSVATFEKLREQAALQLTRGTNPMPPFELLPVEAERGFSRLPVPSSGDVFLDFEGDVFIGAHGREYLFGWSTLDDGYHAIWATDDASEAAALKTFIDVVMQRWAADPGMHVYHFAAYEPTALKRMVGRYGVRAEELDRLVRGRRLVDLHSITKQAARIGVESYGLKPLEALIGYTRELDLEVTAPMLRAVKVSLQRGFPEVITDQWRGGVEAYNKGDCEAAARLRDWLEKQRARLVANVIDIARPLLLDGELALLTAVRSAAEVTAARLLLELPDAREQRTELQQAQWLLGHLMEWFRRESAVEWWEFFRLARTNDEERLEEQRAIAGLVFKERRPRPKRAKVQQDVYTFPPQTLFVKPGDELHTDEMTKIGTVEAIDTTACEVVVKKTLATAEMHSTSCFARKKIAPKPKDLALVQVGAAVADRGFLPERQSSLIRDLLTRALPRNLTTLGIPLRRPGESVDECAIRLALSLDGSVLPMQGPPGTGKTTTASRMIVALVRAGKRVGVTATSHAVIENVVKKTVEEAITQGVPMRAAIRGSEENATSQIPGLDYIDDATEAAARVFDLDLLGATCWQWANEKMRGSVDVLFIDEAGQLCLADAVAVTESTRNLVLLGDPQQLEQPMQGTHPDGVAVSVLQHMIGDAPTVAYDRGLLLDTTYRLHPALAGFTSEQFYARELKSAPAVVTQNLATSPLPQPGLYWLPVTHRGNQNRSSEEAKAVGDLVVRCLATGSTWRNSKGEVAQLKQKDILIVAPFNAHLAAIKEDLIARGFAHVQVGTVDKFQGREAAIAIYSMATSHPEDAPRGLGFLYDRHRLNVATSRARCASVLVACPELLRAECRTPHQLHLVSAMARFVEMSQSVVQ